jgi:LysM repeat protein
MRLNPLVLAGLCLGLVGCRPAATPQAEPSATLPPPATSSAVATPSAGPATPTTAPLPPAAEATADPTAAPLTYTVQAGDTLFAIALAHDVTLDSLRFANGLAGDVIYPGQVLVIPAGTVVPPTPVVSPTPPTELTVVALTVLPNPADRGEQISVSWEVAHATEVSLWAMTYDRRTSAWHRVSEEIEGFPFSAPVETGAAEDQWSGRVPADARYALRFELEALDVEGRRVTATTDVIGLICHPSIAGGGYCPLAVQNVKGAYQAFEHGHLVWRSDTDQIIVIPANPDYYIPWSIEAGNGHPDPFGQTPPGLHPPGEHFAALWSSHRVEASSTGAGTPGQSSMLLGPLLGWAVGPEVLYTPAIQLDLDNTQSGILNDHLFVTLPDGRVASLSLYGGAGGTNGPSWTLIDL